jgi:hypothetical protein
MPDDDDGTPLQPSIEELLSTAAQLAARIRQLLAAQRGLSSSGKKSIADEAQELIDKWSSAELRGDNPVAKSKLTRLLKEHHQISEQILDILDRSRGPIGVTQRRS